MSSIGTTFGVLLLSALINAIGYGITLMQVYLYNSRFPDDKQIIKFAVYSLLLLDTSHIALTWHIVYHYLVLNFMNMQALEFIVWSFPATIVVTAVITLIAHCFFAHRVYVLSFHNRPLLIFILAMTLIRAVFGIISAAKMVQLREFANLPGHIYSYVGTGMGAGSIVDVTISISLVYFFRKNRTGIRKTNNLLDKLTYYAINNGLITSVFGIIFLISAVAMPYNFIFVAFHFFLSKLYANSLLATLNFRYTQREQNISSNGRSTAFAVKHSTFRVKAARAREDDSGVMSLSGVTDSENEYKPKAMVPVVHVTSTTTTTHDTEYPLTPLGIKPSDVTVSREDMKLSSHELVPSDPRV